MELERAVLRILEWAGVPVWLGDLYWSDLALPGALERVDVIEDVVSARGGGMRGRF